MDASNTVDVNDAESCNDSDDGNRDESKVPAYMNAIMRRQYLQEMVKSLPAPIQNRITVLKNIQLEHLELEAEFFEEVYKLEKKYQEKHQPLYDKRKQILSGEVDPPKEEPKWKAEDEEPDKDKQIFNFSKVFKEMKLYSDETKGVPDFWLNVFRSTEILSEMIQEHDEPALRKLVDIKIRYDDEHSYTLEFYFDKNEYFTNSVLTKQYFLKSTVDKDYPFGFEGPEIYKCKGCVINWEKKMNLTIKTIRKKQKHKDRGAIRTIVKQVPNDSFFNFFSPPQIPEDKNEEDSQDDKDEMDEDSQAILATDFEIGHFLRARIIPKAVLYYTGDIIDDEDDDDDEYDGEEEEDEEDESDKEMGSRKPIKNKKKASPDDCQHQ